MTTSIFEFDLNTLDLDMATRPNGDRFLTDVLTALRSSDVVSITFGPKEPTPSFVDQCFGGLIATLGFEDFRRRVKLKNVSPSTRPLLLHVLARRAPQPAG